MLLALDTSTRIASVALFQDGNVRAELTWHSEQNHSRELLPSLEYLVRLISPDKRSSEVLGNLSGVVVATGPGAFNGLRVGVSTAKAVAYACDLPLAGVPTLAALAYQHAWAGLPVCAVLPAGRPQVAAAVYRLVADDWEEVVAPHLAPLEEVLDRLDERTVLVGELRPDQQSVVQRYSDGRLVRPSPAIGLRRAGALAALGARRLAAGLADSPAQLEPLYLRRPPIG